MKRSKKMILLSHCILNSNSKVEGLSDYPAIIKDIINLLCENDIGIMQLPCPEMHIYGINRWGHVKEQFDTPHFRQECRRILKPTVNQVYDYINNGYEIIGVVGVDGSPSCGVNKTCSGNWKGEISNNPDINNMLKSLEMIKGKGIFIEELVKLLDEKDINIPFTAIDEENINKSMKLFRKFLGEKNS